MFKQFDGTDRPPRALQLEVFRWLQIHWNSTNVFALNLPTGVGKSAILRAIQLQFPGSVGIVPTNILMDQYITTYPELNYLKGKDHYESEDLYSDNKHLALDRVATVFNPISYYMFQRHAHLIPPVVIIDEAHKLVDLLMLLVTISFRKSQYPFPDLVSSFDLVHWLKFASQRTKDDDEKSKIDFILKIYKDNPQDFIFYTEERKFYARTDTYLCIKPLQPSRSIISRILAAKKVILMSATLFHSDIWDLGLNLYQYLDLPSPIPAVNRQVVYYPASMPFTYQTSPAVVADYIKTVLTANPGLNTVVHISYTWSKKLQSYFPNALFNTSANKDTILKQFKESGGLWFAAGCSEGIDLPGNECRLTIIPIILKSNIKDPVVAKQLTRERGQLKYELNTIKTVMQQAGRGTRGEDDYSLTIIGDRAFPRLINKNKAFIPKSFLQAIKWSTNVA